MSKPGSWWRGRWLDRARIVVIGGAVIGGAAIGQGAADAAPARAARRPAPAPAPAVDVAALRATLIGRDLDAAVRAAAALGDVAPAPTGVAGATGALAAHDALLDALATGLAPRVAVAALAALVAHPAPGDAGLVRLYARHRSDDVRVAGVTALAGYGDADSHRALVLALGDQEQRVRTAAAKGAAALGLADAVPRLLALLTRGDPPAPAALARLADADLARRIAELFGTAPDALVAQALGQIVLRPDFGPDAARLQIVRALAKIQGPESTAALQEYLEATEKAPPRASRREAESVLVARGGS